MKKLILIVIVLLLHAQWSAVNGQAPYAIPYQAVARDGSGAIIANQNIALRFSIHDVSPAGTVVYKETHSATTNALGLFNVKIGSGTIVTGTFSAVPWGTGAKYLQVEMDPAGGASYIDMGTTEMSSVPYAMHAATADAANESDPQVGSATTNKVPKWNGTTLTDGSITDIGTNVGINNPSPNSSAALDITSTTGSLLLPRMTQAQRDALTPTAGMMVFNTTANSMQAYTTPTVGPLVVDQSQATSNAANYANVMAQSFTAGGTGALYSVTVMHDCCAGTSTLHIRAGNGLAGAIIASQAITVLAGTVGTEIEFIFSAPPTLTSGSVYTIEFAGVTNWGARFNTLNPYAGGTFYMSGVLQSGYDLYFKTKISSTTGGWQSVGIGATGPQGPAGATGATGATGPQGPQGLQGNPGSGDYAATSASVNTIGPGSKTFTTQSGLAYMTGLRARAAVSTAQYMEGQVISYSGTTLIISVDYFSGSGTFSVWNIGVAGVIGATGATGPQGPAGPAGPAGTSAVVNSYFNTGLGFTPPAAAGTWGFLAAPLAVTITSAGQKILVTSSKALGCGATAGTGLRIAVGYSSTGTQTPVTQVGSGSYDYSCPANTRLNYSLSGLITGLPPGTYYVGLVGSAGVTPANWSSHEYSYTTALVVN